MGSATAVAPSAVGSEGPASGSGSPAACLTQALASNGQQDGGLRDRPVGVLALVPGPELPPGWAVLDGADLEVNANSVLFSQVGTAFGGDARPLFGLPLANGPWSALPGPQGSCLTWVLEAVGYLPDERPRDGYPGQVYFTAVQQERFASLLTDAGARVNDLGDAIAPGILAFDLPAAWPAPTVPPLPGEVRLFSETSDLPAGFVAQTELPVPPGYAWASFSPGS